MLDVFYYQFLDEIFTLLISSNVGCLLYHQLSSSTTTAASFTSTFYIPSHFKYTSFLVDRSHWRGHGCASGYSLDKYTTRWISSINSQVNMQANAGLQHIKGQIAYMKPENFMFHVKLFLGITNMDKRGNMDLGRRTFIEKKDDNKHPILDDCSSIQIPSKKG